MLRHVEEEEVLLAERVDRRVEREHDERDPGPEHRPAPAGHRAARAGERAAARVSRGEPRRTVGTTWSGSSVQGVRSDGESTSLDRLVALSCTSSTTTSSRSELRDVEARYVGQARLRPRRALRADRRRARLGRAGVVLGEARPATGFKLRLSELERGAVNVVVQPGHWRVPRIDHLGVALDEDDFEAVLGRAMQMEPARAGARRAAHVRRDERRLPARDPPAARVDRRAARRTGTSSTSPSCSCGRTSRRPRRVRSRDLLGLEARRTTRCEVGETLVRFVAGRPGGPTRAVRLSASRRDRPQLRRRRGLARDGRRRSSSGCAQRSSRPARRASARSPGSTRSTTAASSPPRPTASARS